MNRKWEKLIWKINKFWIINKNNFKVYILQFKVKRKLNKNCTKKLVSKQAKPNKNYIVSYISKETSKKILNKLYKNVKHK